MSMSTNITAFIPDTDSEYQKHKKVFLACHEAGVDMPKQTAEYFDGKEGDEPEMYMLDAKLEINLIKGTHYTDYSKDSSVGFEVDLTKLPKSISKIRFTNSY